MSEEHGEENSHNQHLVIQLSSILLFLILGIYTMAAAGLTGRRGSWFHESSLAILLGFIVSGISILAGFYQFNEASRFNDMVFFYFLLPPIVFAHGYNLKRRRFFQNFNYVFLLGVIGTLLSFITFAVLTYGIFQIIPFSQKDA